MTAAANGRCGAGAEAYVSVKDGPMLPPQPPFTGGAGDARDRVKAQPPTAITSRSQRSREPQHACRSTGRDSGLSPCPSEVEGLDHARRSFRPNRRE